MFCGRNLGDRSLSRLKRSDNGHNVDERSGLYKSGNSDDVVDLYGHCDDNPQGLRRRDPRLSFHSQLAVVIGSRMPIGTRATLPTTSSSWR
jgi:hypothetical protein